MSLARDRLNCAVGVRICDVQQQPATLCSSTRRHEGDLIDLALPCEEMRKILDARIEVAEATLNDFDVTAGRIERGLREGRGHDMPHSCAALYAMREAEVIGNRAGSVLVSNFHECVERLPRRAARGCRSR